MADGDNIFQSFVQAGFESSSHKRRDGKRLDLLRSTKHEQLIRADYKRLADFGISTIRLAARWHLVEANPRTYDFESLAIFLDAAEEMHMEVILDLLHFGWPDWVDVFSSEFPSQFAGFAQATAKYLQERGGACNFIAPVNEISFLSWAGGDVAAIGPYKTGRGAELKYQLARAAIDASEIILRDLPEVRLVAPEPMIHIVGDPLNPIDQIAARDFTMAQYQAWDILTGRTASHLGGTPDYVDMIGINYYPRNQWIHNSNTSLHRSDASFRPFHELLSEVWTRYQRPLFISETGTEGDDRADWFNYICDEVAIALECGIPVHGICLYPILNHPGWDDDRHCCNGLFDYADDFGKREVYRPLAEAIQKQQFRFQNKN